MERLLQSPCPAIRLFNRQLNGRDHRAQSAFTGLYVIQGNFSGFQIWDVTKPSAPRVVTPYICAGVQGDVSVSETVCLSGLSGNGRLDCGLQGVKDSVSAERFRGIRIFDISDIAHPKRV